MDWLVEVMKAAGQRFMGEIARLIGSGVLGAIVGAGVGVLWLGSSWMLLFGAIGAAVGLGIYLVLVWMLNE